MSEAEHFRLVFATKKCSVDELHFRADIIIQAGV